MESSRRKASSGADLQLKMFGGGPARPPGSKDLFAPFFELSTDVLFGEFWTRPELDLKTRSLCTVAALTVLYRHGQLPRHIKGALSNGASKEEIAEVIMQMAFYGGWPCAAMAITHAEAVFDEAAQ
jgi:4-carboxymuconolactone decarboxylase